MKHKAVLRVSSKLLMPPIMLFALYVQFHGDFGPGGGFQAGVIFASAFVLYAILFGVPAARRLAPFTVATLLPYEVMAFLRHIRRGKLRTWLKSWDEYDSLRGMDRWRDALAWLFSPYL